MTCDHPNILNMDRAKSPISGEQVNMTNRVCVRCHQHWYGRDGQVTEYTRQEWDGFISEIDQ